jgi:hypothetical protein
MPLPASRSWPTANGKSATAIWRRSSVSRCNNRMKPVSR